MVSDVLNRHPRILSLSEFFSFVGLQAFRRLIRFISPELEDEGMVARGFRHSRGRRVRGLHNSSPRTRTPSPGPAVRDLNCLAIPCEPALKSRLAAMIRARAALAP